MPLKSPGVVGKYTWPLLAAVCALAALASSTTHSALRPSTTP